MKENSPVENLSCCCSDTASTTSSMSTIATSADIAISSCSMASPPHRVQVKTNSAAESPGSTTSEQNLSESIKANSVALSRSPKCAIRCGNRGGDDGLTEQEESEALLRLRLDELCLAMRLLTRHVSSFPTPTIDCSVPGARECVVNSDYATPKLANRSKATATASEFEHSDRTRSEVDSIDKVRQQREDELMREREIEECILNLKVCRDTFVSHIDATEPESCFSSQHDGIGYLEFSTLYNSCHRLRENLRQTSIESDELSQHNLHLRSKLEDSQRRQVELKKALCKLYKENARLKNKVVRNKKERRSIIRAVQGYAATLQSKKRQLEEDLTRTNMLMHEWNMQRSSSSNDAATEDGILGTTCGNKVNACGTNSLVSSAADLLSSLDANTSGGQDDESVVSASSSSVSCSSLITDDGVATVRFVPSSRETIVSDASGAVHCSPLRADGGASSSGADAESEGLVVADLFWMKRNTRSVASSEAGRRPTYTLKFAPEKRIGLQFQIVPIASIPRSILVSEGEEHGLKEQDYSKDVGLEEESNGPWTMPRSRASTLDEEEVKRTLPVQGDQLSPDAFLVCGYRGFDAGTNVRPTLGARLIAVNGESLECGQWTFEDLRFKIQTHMMSNPLNRVEMTFRNDRLTSRQKELLNSAVTAVEIVHRDGRPPVWCSMMNHLEYRDHSDEESCKSNASGGTDVLMGRVRKFSEDLFRTSSSSLGGEETRNRERAATVDAVCALDDNKRSSKGELKDKMLDLFKASSGEDEKKKDIGEPTPKDISSVDIVDESEDVATNTKKSDSMKEMKERMKKFSEGLSSTFKHLEDDAKPQLSSFSNNPTDKQDNKRDQPKIPKFDFAPNFKKFF